MKIIVTFPKGVYSKKSWSSEPIKYELETFEFECDKKLTDYENMLNAYDEAIKRGHNPNKNIKWKFVE